MKKLTNDNDLKSSEDEYMSPKKRILWKIFSIICLLILIWITVLVTDALIDFIKGLVF